MSMLFDNKKHLITKPALLLAPAVLATGHKMIPKLGLSS